MAVSKCPLMSVYCRLTCSRRSDIGGSAKNGKRKKARGVGYQRFFYRSPTILGPNKDLTETGKNRNWKSRMNSLWHPGYRRSFFRSPHFPPLFSLAVLCTAPHYSNAWNRLTVVTTMKLYPVVILPEYGNIRYLKELPNDILSFFFLRHPQPSLYLFALESPFGAFLP